MNQDESGWLMFGVVSWFLSLPPPLENGEKKLEIYVRDLDATIIERDALAKKNQKEKDQNRWLIIKPREFEFEELKSGKKWLPWQKFFSRNLNMNSLGVWLVRQFFGSAFFSVY